MSTDRIDRSFDDIEATIADAVHLESDLPDADWLRQHRALVVDRLALRAGGGPKASRLVRRQAQVTARRIYRRMVRDAVQRGRGGGRG